MALHIYGSTEHAVLLVGVMCPDGVLRFPNDESRWPGLGFVVQAQLPINEQLIARARLVLGEAASNLKIWQEFSAMLLGVTEGEWELFVAKLEGVDTAAWDWQAWPTLPALIHTLPKDRNRLAYLKAWQVLTGALEETTKALDVEDVVKHLRSEKP